MNRNNLISPPLDNPAPTSSLFSFKLRLPLVIFLVVLAGAAFVFSGVWEGSSPTSYEEDVSLVSYVPEGTVEMVVPAVDLITDQVIDSSAWLPFEDPTILSSGMMFRTGDQSEFVIYFRSTDLIRFFPNTEVIVESVDTSVYPMEFLFRLKTGSVWISTLQGTSNLAIETDRLRIEPEEASTYIRYAEGEAFILSAYHETRVSFLEDAPEDFTGAIAPAVLNDYLLTELHQVSISESGIQPVLAQLRYTKLTKEFPFIYVAETDFEDEWTLQLVADRDRLAKAYTNFVSFLRREGEAGASPDTFGYRWHDAYLKIRDAFTLDKTHLKEVQDREKLEVLYQSLYLILAGDPVGAVERLQRFQGFSMDVTQFSEFYILDQVFHTVNFGSDFYPVKELFRELQLGVITDVSQKLDFSLHFLRDRLNEVYDLLDDGDLRNAKEALYAYNTEWKSLMESAGTDLRDQVQFLTEERQVLQNLLVREPTFYDADLYTVLSELEDRILTLTAEEYDLNEERQAFVQDKIRMLSKLVSYIDAGTIGVDTGVALADLLLEDAQTLLNGITQIAAVNQYFSEKLIEMDAMFRFLDSPDYKLGEGTLEEKFAAYLQKETDMDALASYIQGLADASTSNEAPAMTLDEALTAAQKRFNQAGVKYTALMPMGDTDYRLFKIEGGKVGEIDFEGNYDRETDIVYDLSVQGETFSTGLKLDLVVNAISTMGETGEEVGDDFATEPTGVMDISLSPVEELAVRLVRSSLETQTGMDFAEASITIVNLDENQFKVTVPMSAKNETVLVTFSYDGDDNSISGVTGEVNGETFEVLVSSIDELKNAVEEAYAGN
ncbi:MAG: DUF5667 domain-containing protein [Candidatus Gracilibacteria bacterium]